MLILPGHLAYYFVISVVPIITLIFYITTAINLPVDVITNFIEENFSEDLLILVMPMFENKGISFQTIIYLIVIFYLASNGSDSIIVASNTIFGIKNSGVFKRRLKAFFMTFLLILLFAFILIVPLFGNLILDLFGWLGFGGETYDILHLLYNILNVPVTLLIIFLFVKTIYSIAPDEAIPTYYLNKGAIFTTIGWVIITYLYSAYINNFALYSLYYSGLSTIVMLMLWFWLMSYVFVLGLAINQTNAQEKIEETNALKLQEIQSKIKEKQENKIKKVK